MADLQNSVKVSAVLGAGANGAPDFVAIENSILGAPRSSTGSWGPFSWSADFNLDPSDMTNSSASLKLSVFGATIVNGKLDKNNPKLTANLTVAGVGVKGEAGFDFKARRVYFSGYLNFIFYNTDYGFTILSF